MPFFTKVLLFFSVPTVLFAVLAVPSMRRGSESAKGPAWLPLAEGGTSYLAPPGWTVVDPLTTKTNTIDTRWSMEWPSREEVHAATFLDPGERFQVTVFRGPRAVLEPIATESTSYYTENVMIRREPSRSWPTLDGVALQVEQARYLPGPLAGEDATMLLAFGVRGDEMLLVNAGGATATFPLAKIEELLRNLRVGG